MKKISISQIPSAEVLSAEEMKLLLGGNIAGKGSCKDDCTGACTFTFNKVEYVLRTTVDAIVPGLS